MIRLAAERAHIRYNRSSRSRFRQLSLCSERLIKSSATTTRKTEDHCAKNRKPKWLWVPRMADPAKEPVNECTVDYSE
jgi:hypothetical protein